jgi:hypothetical protein
LNPAPLSTAVAEVVACIPMNVQLPDRLEALVLVLLSFLQAIKQKRIVVRVIKPPYFLMKKISIKTENNRQYCQKSGRKPSKYYSRSWIIINNPK